MPENDDGYTQLFKHLAGGKRNRQKPSETPSGNAAGDGSLDPLDGRSGEKKRTTRKCPVCKGRARWFTCSENKVGPSECPTCRGTGVVATSPIDGDMRRIPAHQPPPEKP